jgi:hypothetical protein
MTEIEKKSIENWAKAPDRKSTDPTAEMIPIICRQLLELRQSIENIRHNYRVLVRKLPKTDKPESGEPGGE